MEVNVNAAIERWQDVEQDVIHIAVDFAHVRGIDKQDVVCPEFVELVDADILKKRFAYRNARFVLAHQ